MLLYVLGFGVLDADFGDRNDSSFLEAFGDKIEFSTSFSVWFFFTTCS